MLKLVDHLGGENMYFSTYESGSLDDTKEQLVSWGGNVGSESKEESEEESDV